MRTLSMEKISKEKGEERLTVISQEELKCYHNSGFIIIQFTTGALALPSKTGNNKFVL